MPSVKSSLTVLFDDPFWVLLYEREYGKKYEVCKITFGAEPKSFEVYDFLLKNYNRLKFSPGIASDRIDDERRINPKRQQREIKKLSEQTGIGTKAQQALKLQHEQNKTERKIRSREIKEAEKDRQYELRRERKKEKHKGH
ncbi:MAG: YjdF family protein [Acutalibacteraceae bacterium]